MARPARLQSATRRSSGGGFLLGMFVGLLLGLGIALAIAFYVNKTPVPFMSSKPKPAEKNAPAKAPAIAGLPQGGAEAPQAPEKPKFDFYRILPGQEEPVSDRELKDRLRAERGQQESARDVYFLQTGSFQNPADADNQKAKLAILGFESSVEPANLPDKGTWYRVRLGPYRKVEEINRVRQALAQNGIDAGLVKAREPSNQKTN
jgi:cell division protein FtsN